MADFKEIIIGSQVGRVQPQQRPLAKPVQGSGKAFEEVLDVSLSKHAAKRIESRQISFSEVERARLSDAFSSLEKKGAKDSLVLMDDQAFIVNVPSKTVVTAMARDQMKEHVFTNIDSTMLV